MPRRFTTAAGAGALAVLLVAGAAGCAAISGEAAGVQRLEAELRAQAADVAREIAGIADETGLNDPADAIQEYARRAEPLLPSTGYAPASDGWFDVDSDATASALVLVAIEASDAVTWQEPVGALVLASRLSVVVDGGLRERDLCLRVELDRWGPTADFDDDHAIAPVVDCPESLGSVTPEPDVRPIVVVPANAEAVATEVLAAAGDETDAELATAITARLDAPSGEREVAAEVQVARDGERIGFAMGTPDDCLLLRAEGGVVERLHVSRIQLEPGELGCVASTALASDEALRPPH
ncbi:hypothetical protein ACGGZK_04405 [Agromyces sp. MMS24-K17]|uniref:hypothetical protein n=1 Tax=Agromyces sp. MMS24-K17 TaxID=3372850 RepID=UPI003754A4FF